MIKIGQRYRNSNGIFEILEKINDTQHKVRAIQKFTDYCREDDFIILGYDQGWIYLEGQDKPTV